MTLLWLVKALLFLVLQTLLSRFVNLSQLLAVAVYILPFNIFFWYHHIGFLIRLNFSVTLDMGQLIRWSLYEDFPSAHGLCYLSGSCGKKCISTFLHAFFFFLYDMLRSRYHILILT